MSLREKEVTKLNARFKRLSWALSYKYGVRIETLVKKETPLHTCYCENKNEGYYVITIDLSFAEALVSAGQIEEGMQPMILEAAWYHEVGHVLHTSWSPLKYIKKKEEEYTAEIPVVAEGLTTAIKENRMNSLTPEETEAKNKLADVIYNVVYWKLMPEMLNSFEDASIENSIQIDEPECFGKLSMLRKKITLSEVKLGTEDFEGRPEGVLYQLPEMLIMEIRHMATIGYYQANWKYNYLCRNGVRKLSPYSINMKSVNELKAISLMARFNAKDTGERLDCSCMAMDEISGVIRAKANEFLDKYLSGLELLEQLEQLKELMEKAGPSLPFPPSEMSINAGAAGTPSPGTSSEYEFDAPDSMKKKAEEKKEEREKAESSSKSESSSSKDNDSDSKEDASGSDSKETKKGSSKEKTDSSKESKEESGDGEDSKSDTTDDNSSDGSEGSEKKKLSADDIGKISSARNSMEERAMSKALEKAIEDHHHASVNDAIRDAQNSLDGEKVYDSGSAMSKHSGVSVIYDSPTTVKKSSANVRDKYSPDAIKDFNAKAYKFSAPLKNTLVSKAKENLLKGEFNGKLSKAGLYRSQTDLRAFEKKTVGSVKHARFTVLLDQSGSMSCKKIELAREATYVLTEACIKAGIPVSVFGHSTNDFGSDEGLRLIHYVDYTGHSYPESILSAQALYNNRDGMAIFESCAYMLKYAKPGESLICIVISDGLPEAFNYHGEPAVADVKRIVSDLKKYHNIKTIGVGIGRGTQYVEDVYENSLYVPDLENLTKELLGILKKEML